MLFVALIIRGEGGAVKERLPVNTRASRRRDRRRRRRASSGFTLVELLVVIAIITILAALVMPATISALRQGESTRCKSNLHQIGAALITYAQNNAGLLPRHDDSEARVIDAQMWWRTAQGQLVPLLREWRIFQCPADEAPSSELGVPRWHSYGYNTNYYDNETDTWRGWKFKNISEVDNAVAALVFLDSNEGDGGVDGNSDRGYQDWPISNPRVGLQRHSRGFNAAFLDGHVQYFKVGETTPENYEWY